MDRADRGVASAARARFTAGTRPMALSAVAATRKDKGRLMHALMYTS